MKKGILISFLLLSALFTLKLDTFYHREKPEEENPFLPDEWMFRQRVYPYGTLDEHAIKQAVLYLREHKKMKDLLTTGWVFAGPNVYGGRVTDIEFSGTSTQTIYVGSASGGIFKTTDQGLNWTPVFDGQAGLSIGDMALSKQDTAVIFAGTGEPNAGGGSLAYDGTGVYKSVNGGITWDYTGLGNCGSTGKIAVDPANDNRVFAAMMGNLFGNNPERGIYRSLDGGFSWENVLNVSDSTGGIDVVFDPVHPDTVFAAMWERVRRPGRRVYGGPASGIYRSLDGGNNWSKMTTGLPSAGMGRISLAINPQNPAVLYAAVVGQESLTDVYKS
ncbi:MAG: hypothetical protein NTU44_03380, partial [Bacteroidetes bacterium]|nr:hypothetical protein [Bacteroidota bacterium]